MTNVVAFTVFGTPRPLPRARHVKGRKRPVSIIDPNARIWRDNVERMARQVDRRPDWLAGPVRVDTWFYMPTRDAKRWGRLHAVRPDKDNLKKMVLDCLERAGLLPKGDERVARGEAVKLWARVGGCVVEIRPAEAPEPDDDLGVAFVGGETAL